MGIYNRKNLALVLALFNVFIVFLGIGLSSCNAILYEGITFRH